MTAGLDNIVQSARKVAVSNSTSTSSHSSLVSLPVFSLPQEEQRSKHDILDEEEAYLSPEERMERRKVKEQIKLEAHNKLTNQVAIIKFSTNIKIYGFLWRKDQQLTKNDKILDEKCWKKSCVCCVHNLRFCN